MSMNEESINTEVKESLKTYPMVLWEGIESRLDALFDGARNAEDAVEMGNYVIALIRAALNATRLVEYFYDSQFHEKQMKVIQQVALRHHMFIQTYEFRFPLGISQEPNAGEGAGDRMRRRLTREWHANSPFNQRKNWDDLGYAIDGFLSSVYRGDRSVIPEVGRSFDFLTFASRGFVAVPADVREGLLDPDSRKNASLWGRAFADWYFSHRPWPYTDKKGNLTWPDREADLKDPIHRIAYKTLMTRMRSNPNDKSVVTALRAAATKRFKSLFLKNIDQSQKNIT